MKSVNETETQIFVLISALSFRWRPFLIVMDKLGISQSFNTYPASTWRLYTVVSTSMQRHDVASTLRQRCIDVMCLLGRVSTIIWSNRPPSHSEIILDSPLRRLLWMFQYIWSMLLAKCAVLIILVEQKYRENSPIHHCPAEPGYTLPLQTV